MTTLPDKYIMTLPDVQENEQHPESPKYTMYEMAKMCEKYLPIWNAKRFAEEPSSIEIEPFVLK